MTRPGPLLRLVHSLERRRAGRPFSLHLCLRHAETHNVLTTARHSAQGPRAFVIGAGDRVDLAAPTQQDVGLLPRHIAIVVVPRADGCEVRAVSLHPERGVQAIPLNGPAPIGEENLVGGALARDGLRLLFDGLALEVRTTLEDAPPVEPRPAQIVETWAPGTQLSFYSGASVRALGDVVLSVAGPTGGGHAVPALVQVVDDNQGLGGTLVLRTRGGVHRVEVTAEELQRGLLIGRSRRCVLGRGFDENDGLSRVHALVLGLEEGVFAFDLASRYGLRDVSRPTRLTSTSRIDNGIGCLVYGAGFLTFEP